MLKLPSAPAGEAGNIVKKFINNRLIKLMEGIILDEVAWDMILDGEAVEGKSFDELVDIVELMQNSDFAENVSMQFLPEDYPLEKANHEFLGLYQLLKKEEELVPELPMEYVLFQVIFNEIWQIDQTNEDSEDGLFDDLIAEFGDDPLFEGMEEEVYDTVERIPEPDRGIVLKALEESAEEVGDGTTAEDMILLYEDLRRYEEACFWDTDFAFLDEFDWIED